MSLGVLQIPCLQDNYGFLVRDQASGLVAAIDPPDAAPLEHALAERGWALSLIMNTHWHRDHTGGNRALTERYGALVYGPAEVARSAHVDVVIGEGESIQLGDTVFRVIDTGGHTLEHISYYAPSDSLVFVGDTLFAMGCGRLFEGSPGQMWASLQRLAALPDDTTVYCAHEYTEANARFAISVDSDRAVAERAEAVFAQCGREEPTVPTTIALERSTNPFLRAPLLRPDLGEVEAFAAIRAAKDAFRS